MFPVLLEVNTLFDDSLFLGGVETAAIADRELEPGSGWVSVTQTTLVVSPELVRELLGLWPVGKLISTEVSEQLWVSFTGFLLEIPLIEIVLPSLYLPLRIGHFNY